MGCTFGQFPLVFQGLYFCILLQGFSSRYQLHMHSFRIWLFCLHKSPIPSSYLILPVLYYTNLIPAWQLPVIAENQGHIDLRQPQYVVRTVLAAIGIWQKTGVPAQLVSQLWLFLLFLCFAW